MSLSVLLLYLRLFFIASQSFNPLHMSLFQRCLFSEFFLSEVLRVSLGEQIDGCARSAEIMVKKGDRRHIWYDVGIPCQN